MKRATFRALLLGAACASLASPAVADDIGAVPFDAGLPGLDLAIDADLPSALAVAPDTPVTQDADAASRDTGAAISDEELDGQRGGQAIILTNQSMTAITSGNVLNGGYTAGAVSLSDNALSNFNGIGNLLINTGAQVSLQTGMNITINIGD